MYRAIPIRLSNGRTITKSVLSKRARERKALLVANILQQLGGRAPRLTRECQISYSVTPRDERTPDVDAFEKGLLDALQAAGVVANDKLIVQVSKERLPMAEKPGWIDLELTEVPA